MPASPTPRKSHQPKGLIILHEDRDIVVVDKAPGLLTVATANERRETAYYRLNDYVRHGNPKSRERIFIVHRLDREVSGILVFARSEAAKRALQGQWDQVEKRYLALVQGEPRAPEGVFSSYLIEEGVHRVRSTPNAARGKLSHTAYRLLASRNGVSLLEISLMTGRKHQIRVHLAENGLPILGDRKYGVAKYGEKRVALHARSLDFRHPYSGEPRHYETPQPPFVARYLDGASGR